MLISNSNSISSIPLSIFFNNQPIIRVKSFTYLGVIIDEKLKFDQHTKYLCSKVSKSIGIFYKIRYLVPDSVLFNLYHTLVYPYLNYCNVAWCGTYWTHLNSLWLLQKRVIRIIHRKPFLFPTNQLFLDSKLLKLPEIYSFKLGMFIFDIQDQPNFSRTHNYNSRYRNLLYPPSARLTTTQHSVFNAGIRCWNAIPEPIRNSRSISIFKNNYKSHLISLYTENS